MSAKKHIVILYFSLIWLGMDMDDHHRIVKNHIKVNDGKTMMAFLEENYEMTKKHKTVCRQDINID